MPSESLDPMTGVGYRIYKDDINKLPRFRQNIKIKHEFYSPKPRNERTEYTGLSFDPNDKYSAIITIGDSKEGWVESIGIFLNLLTSPMYSNVTSITINYDNIRPAGERLITFGGQASGPESMKAMFTKIDKVIKNQLDPKCSHDGKLRPIHVMDILDCIAENVVIGGTRRSACIVLFESNDEEMLNAKADYKYIEEHKLFHRYMSNNSVIYNHMPSKDEIRTHIQKIKNMGEPGFINGIAASDRKPTFKGCNPCAEILLDDKGLCNLTTVAVDKYIKFDTDNENGKLDLEGLIKAQSFSARMGYRLTCLELELPVWDAQQNKYRLLGCSLTGWQDMVTAIDLNNTYTASDLLAALPDKYYTIVDTKYTEDPTMDTESLLLTILRTVARVSADEMADKLGTDKSELVTCIKPEGTLSLVAGGVSPGVHFQHSKYFIRRIRVNAKDPIVKVCEELGYPILPDVGQTMKDAVTLVVEFPVMSKGNKFKGDVSAIEQLEIYSKFMKYYVDHNASNTITVRDHEWEDVVNYLHENWENIVGVTFLSYDDNKYELAPYEEITQEEYIARKSKMRPFNPDLISKYEIQRDEEIEEILDNADCTGGVCPIR